MLSGPDDPPELVALGGNFGYVMNDCGLLWRCSIGLRGCHDGARRSASADEKGLAASGKTSGGQWKGNEHEEYTNDGRIATLYMVPTLHTCPSLHVCVNICRL